MRLFVSDDIAITLDIVQVMMLCNLVLLTLPVRASARVAIVIGQLLPVRGRIVTNLSKICIAMPHKLRPVCGALLNELVRLLN